MKRPDKRLIIIGVVIVLLMGGIVWFKFIKSSDDSLVLSGTVEATTSTLSFRVGGNVAVVSVDEGISVNKGDVLATLDTSDLKLELRMAVAEEAMARSALNELEAGSRPEEIAAASADVSQARAALAELEGGFRVQKVGEALAQVRKSKAAVRSAQATLAMAKADEIRFKKLYKSGSIGKREYESYRTRYLNAVEGVKEAKAGTTASSQQLSLLKEGSRKENVQQSYANLQKVQARYDLVMAGPRQEKIAQARAKLQAARGQVNLSTLRLDYSTLRAPFDGVVLVKALEVGENVAPGTPAFSLAMITTPWLRCYVQETDLSRIALGQEVKVSVDGLDRTFTGRISFISSRAEFTPKTVETQKERVNLVYRIKVALKNDKGIFKIGMPATARPVIAP